MPRRVGGHLCEVIRQNSQERSVMAVDVQIDPTTGESVITFSLPPDKDHHDELSVVVVFQQLDARRRRVCHARCHR